MSWAQITLSLLGAPITGVTNIKYSVTQEKVNVYGAGSKPVSRGRGRKEYSGSITLLAEEFKNILAAAPNGDVLDIPPFDVTILHIGTSGLMQKTVWKYAEMTENSFDVSEGDTSISIEIPFIMADIVTTTV